MIVDDELGVHWCARRHSENASWRIESGLLGRAVRRKGRDREILRRVFWLTIALASLVGILVCLQACVPPWTDVV